MTLYRKVNRYARARAARGDHLDPAEVVKGTVPEVRQAVEEHPEILEDVLAAEEEGKGRKTILALADDPEDHG